MFAEEHLALEWFKRELKLDPNVRLYSLIASVREEGSNQLYYHRWLKDKESDHARLLVVPEDPVMEIHGKIKTLLLKEFKRKPWSFGFMGGSCEQAANQHKQGNSFLKFDLRHAFFQVGHENVLEGLTGGEYGSVSKWVARFIADLCTAQAWPEVEQRYGCKSFLPQGSPTSPILFDIACGKLDGQMVKLAERVRANYTRYADNIVFSMPDKRFPPKVRRAVLHEAMAFYPVHKVSESNFGEPFHMLGLQIANHQVRMTREYKRRLKGALYHLNYAAEHGIVDERAMQKARGLMGFAVWEQLSPQTIADFQANCPKKAWP